MSFGIWNFIVLAPLMVFIFILGIELFIRRFFTRSVHRRLVDLSRHHIATRIIVAMLGLGALFAVGIKSWSHTQETYASGVTANRPPAIHLRTKDAPPLPLPTGENKETGVKEIELSGRLLVRMVIVEDTGSIFRPVYAWEFEPEWRAVREKSYEHRWQLAGYDLEYQFTLHSLSVRKQKSGENLVLCAWYSSTLNADRLGYNLSRSSSSVPTDPALALYEGSFGTSGHSPAHLLSISPPPDIDQFHVFLFTDLVTSDDPLREASAEELLNANREFVQTNIRGGDSSSSRPNPDMFDDFPSSKGLALAAHLDLVAGVLFLAACLLAQAFSNRPFVFAFVLLGVVLYTAALDRMLLNVHLAHLEDHSASVETRMLAANHTPTTFFYRGTAEKSLQAIATDPREPEALRTQCASALKKLSADDPGSTPDTPQ